jgi:flagellar hook-associated protein 2
MSLGLLNAGNVSQYNTQVEQLIRQIIQSESKPISQLQERKTSLEKQQEIFDQASSTLANLQTKAEGISSLFDQRTSASSNPDILGVSAGAGAKPGIYEVSVERLAKAHTLASHRIPSQGTNLAQIFGPGQHHFFVTTQGRRVEVVLEIPEVMDETGQPPTNDDLLRLVAEAIQKANAAAGFGQHGFGGQVLRDTPTSTRLVLKSNCTGSSNQLFLEDPEGVLQVLGIQPESKATEMTGGWIYAPEGQAKLREETVNLFQPLVISFAVLEPRLHRQNSL